jgi:hypothetical protein
MPQHDRDFASRCGFWALSGRCRLSNQALFGLSGHSPRPNAVVAMHTNENAAAVTAAFQRAVVIVDPQMTVIEYFI